MTLKRFAVTAVFTITCFSVPVARAAAAGEGAGSAVRPGAEGAAAVRTEEAEKARPDFSKGALGEQVRDLRAQFREQQKALLDKYQELMKAAKDASVEERAKIRTQLREELKTKLDELIAKQKELRTELKQQFQEHRELVEAAKEKAKEKVRERRGNSSR